MVPYLYRSIGRVLISLSEAIKPVAPVSDDRRTITFSVRQLLPLGMYSFPSHVHVVEWSNHLGAMCSRA